MRVPAAAATAALVVALAACGGGESKSDKAQKQVCSARADISKQVNTLKGLTLSAGSVTQVTDALKAIGEDLNKIKDAQGDLSGDRKKEVQQANQAFESSVKSIASSLGSSTSLSDAKAQLTAALQGLASSYEQTFAKLSCS